MKKHVWLILLTASLLALLFVTALAASTDLTPMQRFDAIDAPVIYENWTTEAVKPVPAADNVITLETPTRIEGILNWHWDGRYEDAAGQTISLVDTVSSAVHGPWPVVCVTGDGGWYAFPDTVLPAGTYKLADSDPATWDKYQDKGMTRIKGTAVDLWTNYAAAGFASGAGTKTEPYEIATAEQLALLAGKVNYGSARYRNNYFVLTDDIDLAGHLWDPIGRWQNQSFEGHFDGRYHVVKNMTVKASSVPQYQNGKEARDSGSLGLFGHTSVYSGATLCNLGLVNGRIEIDRRETFIKAGLLAGTCEPYRKTVSDCFAEGEVIATAELQAEDNLGGLIGYGKSLQPMENCYFVGKITQPTDKAMLGGLAGKLYSNNDYPSEISNSYAAAEFSPRGAGLFWRNIGRYSGYFTLNNAYYDNSASAHITTDSVNFSQDLYTSADGTGLSGAEMMTRHMAGVLNHHSGNTVWAQSPDLNGGYPVLNAFHPELTDAVPAEIIFRKGGTEAEITADTILTAAGVEEQKPYLVHVLDQNGRILPDAAVTWTVEDSDTVTVDESGLVTVAADAPEQTCTVRATFVDNTAVTKTFTLTVQHTDTPLWTDNLEPIPDYPFSGGSGSEKSPYLIGSVRDLAQLAVNVNGGVAYDYNHNRFRLTQNLDLSGKFWFPIGQSGHSPEGLFDGDGHVISGMKLRSSLLPIDGGYQYVGLFGSSGVDVKRLGMEGAELVLDQAAPMVQAGVLGASLNTVSYCYANDSTITVSEACRESNLQIGGLAEYLRWDMVSCWFRGTIDDQSGNPDTHIGVLDFNNSNYSEVLNSWSDAVIRTKGTDICNKGSFYTVDGLPQGSYNPCYGGIRTREQLKSAEAAMALNENSGDVHPWVWQETVNGGYPQLAVFCGELEEKAAANLWIRKGGYDVTEDTIVTRQSENAVRKELKAHVADRYGRPMSGQSVTWTVEPAGAGVTIDEALGTVTVAPETAAGDYTVTAACGTGTDSLTLHVIRPDKGLWSDGLTASPDCTFSGGDGTEAAPYLISSETDLAQLAVNVNAGTSYDSKYFRLERDLDLSGKYWVPIGGRAYRGGSYNEYASSYIYSFAGSFDGDFHTVTNMEILYDVLWDRLGADYRQNFSYAGLFGTVDSGLGGVKNLALENASAAVYDWGRGFYAQGICKDKEEWTGVGLLAGMVYGGNNERVYVDCCSAEGRITVGAYARGVGGLAGISRGGMIRNTFFKGSIAQGGGYTVGGTAGAASANGKGIVNHSFSAATISSRATVYGIYSFAADNCVYDSTLLPADTIRSTQFKDCHERAMTTEQLKSHDGTAAISDRGTWDGSLSQSWGWDGTKNDGYPFIRGFGTAKPVLWTDGVTADANTVFAGGNGTVDDPFKIAAAEQLALLAQNVNSGTVADAYQGKFFRLIDDLDLSGKYWVPVGINGHAFKGAFDGGFHTVSNMTVRSSTIPGITTLGFFGNVAPGSFTGEGIRNILLTEAAVEADVPGSRWIGAVTGYSQVPLLRCGVQGTITSYFDIDYLGGLVGRSDDELRSCFFRGEINVRGGDYHGGLLGSQGNYSLYNCYASASIASTADFVYPVANYCETCFYNQELCNVQAGTGSDKAAGLTEAQLKDADSWRLLNGPGGNVDSRGNADENLHRSCRDWGQKAGVNEGYPIPRGFLHETYDLWTDHAADAFAGGDGLTAETAYEIATAEQLALLAKNVNSGAAADGYQGRFFRLTADLYLGGRLWEPIGLSGKAFRGSFDGGMHTISSMTVRDLALPRHRHLGLFGCVHAEPEFAGAGIRNTLLAGVDLRVELPDNRWVGSLAGTSYNPVERCGAEGTVAAGPYVTNLGGLVGWSDGGGDSCFFRGTVTAGAGYCHSGLIGWNNSKYFCNVYAAADFTSQAAYRYPVLNRNADNFYYDSTLCPVTADSGLDARDAVGKTTEEMQTYAFAMTLNGAAGNSWTSTGGDYPVLSGGRAPVTKLPAGLTAMAGTSLSAVKIPTPAGSTPGVWMWVQPEKSVGNQHGEFTFAAVFFPADTGYTIARKDIPVKVKAWPVLTITDDASTPEIEVSVQYAEAGWCIAAVYTADGQMLACGTEAVQEGDSHLTIALGEYEPREGLFVRVFLLNQAYIPQAPAAGKP